MIVLFNQKPFSKQLITNATYFSHTYSVTFVVARSTITTKEIENNFIEPQNVLKQIYS